jgi:hypothetical protein
VETVVPLRARRARNVVPMLALALALGGAVAACCLAMALGVGAELEPAYTASAMGCAAAALLPAAFLGYRWQILRPPARLVVGPEAVTIAYPELLRRPFVVPRAVMRIAAVDARGDDRFRVHTASGPYWGGEGDGYLWSRGATALPVLAPHGAPNVLLLFEEPIGGAEVRRSRLESILRGERVAGLLLAADDPVLAEHALAPLGLSRPLTMPDALRLEEHLNTEDGGRFALAERHLLRSAWSLIAVGVVVPILAAVGGVLGAVILAGGKRLHGAVLALLGFGVFAVRLVLWLG